MMAQNNSIRTIYIKTKTDIMNHVFSMQRQQKYLTNARIKTRKAAFSNLEDDDLSDRYCCLNRSQSEKNIFKNSRKLEKL